MSSSQPKDHRDLLKRALLKIDNLQAQLDKQHEPIAIIGMSLRFPNGANDPEKFWHLLREGVDCITEIPASRWNVEDYYDPDPAAPGKMYTRCAGFIDHVEQFDPQFFGIAPREAQSMDPQQRLLLEVTWEALERAGQAPNKLAGSRTGVYIGISGNDYSHLHTVNGGAENIDTYFGAGVAHSIASGRISYVLGLQGPSLSVDTACSASLTAVHLACQSLRAGETEMALAGGVNVILTPEGIITASQARMLSPEGRCKTFDASANGYVRAEGCAIIVLKRLSEALAHGDNILALIRGTAANQDGRSGGLTAPNGEAQQAVIRAALANANLKPEDISYLETHGTGTALGDPIEVQAIGAVFSASHSKANPLLIGAVKSNVGHLEAAAGIAGLIKTILALQHGELPPSLHVQKLNPHLAWDKLPMQVTTALTPWAAGKDKQLAGVSSFGFSGTNVHVILEGAKRENEAKAPTSNGQHAKNNLLCLSAKNETALRELALRYKRYLASQDNSPLEGGQGGVDDGVKNFDAVKNTPLNPPSKGDSSNSPHEGGVAHNFANICFTANAGRAHFNHRLALFAETSLQAREQLAAFARGEVSLRAQQGKVEDGQHAEVAFLFTGQGSQYLNMGKQLYETQPVFRAALDKCDELLRPYLYESLLSVLYPEVVHMQSNTPLNPPSMGDSNHSPLERGHGGVVDDMKNVGVAVDSNNTPLTPLKGGIAVSHEQSTISNQQRVSSNQQPATSNLLHQTAYTQPALFALEYALAELWRSWGIVPSAVMGHSVGEYVAACVAGVFSLEDGLKLIAARARLMQALPANGNMAAVFANEPTVRQAIMPYLDKVDIAAINGPNNIVISGECETVQEILRQLESDGIKHKPLAVSHAFHSPLMDPMLDEFERVASAVQYSAPRIPLLSNVTGQFVADDEITNAQYWRKHVRAAVRFADAMTTLHERGYKIFVEIGPTPTLLSMGRRCLPEEARSIWLPSLRNGREEEQQILETLAALYVQGANVAWERFHREDSRRRVVLPTYPFQRQRYWVKAAERVSKIEDRRSRMEEGGSRIANARSAILDNQSSILHPLLGQTLRSALQEIQFEAEIDLHTLPLLREHQFYGTPVFPAAAYIEMALAAAQEIYGAGRHVIESCNIHEVLLLSENEARLVQFIFTPETETNGAFQVFSSGTNADRKHNQWTLHASGTLRALAATDAARIDLPALEQRCALALDVKGFYEKFKTVGVEYGASFQSLARLWQGEQEALAEIRVTDEGAKGFRFHPGVLDACFQLFGAALNEEEQPEQEAKVYMPVGFDRMEVYRDHVEPFWCHVKLHAGEMRETLRGDVFLFEESGEVIAKIVSLRFKRTSAATLARANQKAASEWLYEVQWQEQVLPEIVAGKSGKLLLLTGENDLSAAIMQQLVSQKLHAIVVRMSTNYARVGENEWQINPARREDFVQLFEEVFSFEEEAVAVVHAWSLAARLTDSHSAEDVLAAEKMICESALHLVQALAQRNWPNPPRLWLLTRGALDSSSLEGVVADGVKNFNDEIDSKHTPLNSPSKGDFEHSPLEGGQGGVASREKNFNDEKHTPLKGGMVISPVQTSLWGLANVIALEHPALQCSRIDLASNANGAQEARLVLNEIFANTRETQVALRHGQRFVARLMPAAAINNELRATGNQQPATNNQQPLKLEIHQRGVLENLKLVSQTRRAPTRGEVEVRVFATGLNFRDVLNVLGMYPGDPGPLGNECVGKIVALGEGVRELRLGEHVMVLAADSFASYVTTDARFVLPMPQALGFEEAATLPITFLTAHYALNHLGQMQRGERVLIHAAAGGVGLAAIQLAQRAGVEIFATAGSAEKHAYLRGLGVKNIFSSRTLDFAEEIMSLTNGEGIDIVLNALAGEFIPKSLSLLRTGGRFLEIGKTDVWNEARVKALKPEIDYHVIYLGQTIQEQPALLRTLFEELTHAFERNELRPLPFTTFALDNAVQAYRYMAQAKHIGKVVVVQRTGDEDRGSWMVDRGSKAAGLASPAVIRAIDEQRSATYDPKSTIFHPQSSILLTGGLGALGLHVAQWLVEKGARHLVLVGRKAPSASAQAALHKLEQKGAKLVVAARDISQEDEVRRVLDEIAATLPPLRGIIHSAGVLDDGVLMQQEWARFERVLAPKVLGAWHLHRLTKDLPLDFFVMFSSIASMFGAMSQGNYAAANAFMDGLAHYRRAHGLPALSINWGAWAEGGMVTELGARAASRLTQQGLSLITPENGMRVLEQLLTSSCRQVAVLPIHWPKFFEQFNGGAIPSLYEKMAKSLQPQERNKPTTAPRFDLLQMLECALPSERLELLTAHVREQVVKVLGLDAMQAPALHQGLTDLGMDSLMAVELSNHLRASVGRTLPSTLAFEYPTIAALTKYLAEDVLQLVTSEVVNPTPNNTQNGSALLQQEIEQIAESDLEDSLLQELEEAGY